MINAAQLLTDLKRQLKRLEDDLRTRVAEVPELKASLATEWQAARDAARTAETFESWSDQLITQAGVHWLLSCVFLRFIEDNQLVERPWLAGSFESGQLTLAQDRHEAYFRIHPLESDRDYLLASFREAGTLPGLTTFFDEVHNPVFRLGISGDAAMALRQFWQLRDPNTGALTHDFTDREWNTRFLGDLYQDLSEDAKKRYALLQTPEFVEEFILDRTLTPAIREFGYREVRLIDPTCGSGHFLLGAFQRLAAEWARYEPGRNARDVAQKALDAVAGVDLNPFAVAIARFRLLVAALRLSGVHLLAQAPNFKLSVVIGDSLLHGSRFGMTHSEGMFEDTEAYANSGLAHAYHSEDLSEVQFILGRQYHAVVGNPPYITVKDKALNAAYRERYISCHMKYSLGAPFTERFFELAISGNGNPAGYVGLITANSFMKREFGSRLIEAVLPRLDLTHVVDTSGAYIPGHGTPTVILFGRDRAPVGETIRTVMGIKGEPATPDDPARGLVWSAIGRQIDQSGSESVFISVADSPRVTFAHHPWSIGGGGAAELKEQIEQAATEKIGAKAESIGFASFTGADDLFSAPQSALKRAGIPEGMVRDFVVGDSVRDYTVGAGAYAFAPYKSDLTPVSLDPQCSWAQALWPFRSTLEGVISFGGRTRKECGDQWWTWYRWVPSKYHAPLSITFAEVASHNHFVLDRGGKVFKQTAPLIKLPVGSSEDEHLGLLGLLNSSVACFWLKQVCHNKGSTVDQRGARQRTAPFEDFYAFNSTKVSEFPLPRERPLAVARRLDSLARDIVALLPTALLQGSCGDALALITPVDFDAAGAQIDSLRRRQISLQETLDWSCYILYDMLPEGGKEIVIDQEGEIEVALGERAFEIVLARRMAAGKESSNWFERHGSMPVTEIPMRWPAAYRELVQRRIDLIERDRNIRLIERPEYKRRWNTPTWQEVEKAALRCWLLDRMEVPALWPASTDVAPELSSVNRLADLLRGDVGFIQVASLFSGRDDFDLTTIVAELVASESVPFLPVLRYKESGLRKRAQWEETWELQRREDAGQNVGKIPVPPDYKSADFIKTDCWRLRGGLDVPKERWISYPGCERGADGSLPLAWAGWNHLQQATALASYYLSMKESEGWEPIRLQPLLAGLLELVPWLKQWHNELDPVYGARVGDHYEDFVRDEARGLGYTLDDLKGWKPTAAPSRRRRASGSAQ
ncbi:MAG: BREX-2 system adenine-specific DNA-methyltransferase PglX [Pseudomonadota bacterium]